jgi:hypothetical protein
MAAVKHSGVALQFASEGLRADFDIAMVGVKSFGGLLQHLSDDLKADRRIVMTAILHSRGGALKHASMGA